MVARALRLLWAYRVIRWSLSFVFLYSGATKLADPGAFAVLIDAYGILPDALLMPVAVGLPTLEVAAAIGLIMDIRGPLAVIGALLAVFMAVLAYGLWMGLDVDCGCFGPDDIESRAYHGLREAFYRDLAMMAGIFCLYGWRYFRSIRPVGYPCISTGDERRIENEQLGQDEVCVDRPGSFYVHGRRDRVGRRLFEENSHSKRSPLAGRPDHVNGYKLIGTEELKVWIDAKKDILIVDTMPYEDSYKKSTCQARQFLFPSRR
jgi:uncharacterized membrane protein YphA (DoxX/SURF4 family)